MKKVLLYFWQLPQNLIGIYLTRKAKFRRKFNNNSIYILDYGEGFSLGNYVFVNPNCSEGNLLRHEYGHCIQSLILGWLYMFIIFLPSFIWWKIFCKFLKDWPDEKYYVFYTESWANKLVKKKRN